jgi:hypothetical protein
LETIDIIIGLLDTGKALYNKESAETSDHRLCENNAAIMKIVTMINQLTGYERPNVVTDYIVGKVNLQNTILRLVVDEPKEPLTPISTSLIPFMGKRDIASKVIPMRQGKRGKRKRYNKKICIEVLREISSHLGPTFTRMDYIRYTREHEGFPNHITLVKHVCGKSATWDEVLSIAGLQPKKYPMAK